MFKYLTSPSLAVQAATQWCLTSGVWWASSVAGHVVVIAALLVVLGKVTAPPTLGDAPLFEARVDPEIPEATLDHFEVGQTPLDPSELNTETLSLADAPQIEVDQQAGDSPDSISSGGGSSASATGGMGGLDQFAVKGIGPGPLVRGSGLAGSGTGRNAGSGGAGSGFGARGDKDARRAMVGGYGGTKASERAVAAALNWFSRHQAADGSWSIDGYTDFCKGEPCAGGGNIKSDMAATAMALLPFLAAGQTHMTKGPYRKTIEAGISWVINHQKRDGDLRDGLNMYTHGLASIMLCEAFALSNDSYVRVAAEGAIRFIESAQNQKSGGWHYDPQGTPPSFGDTSVVGWQVMALKSAQMAGLQVSPRAIAGSHKWLDAVKHGSNGGLFSYNPDTAVDATPPMTAVGLLCNQYLGSKRMDPAILEGQAYLMTHLPRADVRNSYYWYYATQVMHNLPGPEWDAWNREMRRILIDSQIKQGCAAGSWDPALPVPDPWSGQGGRIMVTSLCCLTLEVYYRYLPLYKLDGQDKPDEPEANTSAAAPEKPSKPAKPAKSAK